MSVEALKKMAALGLSLDQAIEIMEAMEVPSRTAGAARQARYRARKAEASQSDVTRDVTSDASPPPPLAPSPQTPQPHTPPPGEQSRPRKGRSPAKPETDLTERVWQAASKPSRDRSGRPALGKAVLAAIRAGATDEALIASVRDHCRAQGEFAKGVHHVVAGEHWRDHQTRPANDAQPPDPTVLASRLRRYRDTGIWEPGWGPKPPDDDQPAQGAAA